jgi:NADPH-dependent 2,4-dienoyl-CoA reductase/sulfur reductase-like enzyme
VTLYEKEARLGGLMRLAAIVKDLELEAILDIIRYLDTQMKKLGVTVRTNQALTPSLVDQMNPDAVILATGGSPFVPAIPGIDNKRVIDNARLHRQLKFYLGIFGPKLLSQLTKLWMPIGKTVLIIGGGLEGCQLAEFLVKRGRKVTIVDAADQLGKGLLSDDPDRLFKWFAKKGVETISKAHYERITDEGLVITGTNGKSRTIPADTIITALPLQPTVDLENTLRGKVAEVHRIGDSREAGYMYDAIADGSRIGRLV